MHRGYLKTAVLFAALAVMLGAFVAHILKDSASEKTMNIFETGVRYQFYHTFALLISAILLKDFPGPLLKWACKFFISGILLFSFSLYILGGLQMSGHNNFQWIGAITPLGGMCFISGWLFMFIRFVKNH